MGQFADDIANDFELFDETHTVTVEIVGLSPISVADVTYSKWSFTSVTLAGSTLGLQDQLRAFSLPQVNLGLSKVPDGSMIVDDENNRWIVQRSNLATVGTRVRCECVLQQGPNS